MICKKSLTPLIIIHILLSKLKHCDIRGVAYRCVESYLQERKHVLINGFNYKGLSILNGVPQGSVLGLLLFFLCISDLHTVIKHCKFHHFADDSSLLHIINSVKK